MTVLGPALRLGAAFLLCVMAAFVVVTLRARGWSVVPDLVLLPIIALGLSRGTMAGALLGLAAGWVVDLVPPGGQPLGLTALLYAAAGALAGRGTRVGPLPTRWIAVMALAAVAVPALGRLLHGAYQGTQLAPSAALLEAVATLLAALVIVPPLVRLDTHDREEVW
ncbi:MAG: rod shape-determining protein MreD [Actinomycetia bacterium]|nr:rod shape-determining protein MreD [Actinomycetes bacterium]